MNETKNEQKLEKVSQVKSWFFEAKYPHRN